MARNSFNIKIKEPKTKKPKREKLTKAPKENKVKFEKTKKLSFKSIFLIALFSVIGVVIVAGLILGGLYISDQKERANKVRTISLSSTPYVTEYFVGEELDCEGLLIVATKNNGQTFYVDISDCTISGFDSSIPKETQIVTVNYKGLKVTFSVKIKQTSAETPILVAIRLETLPKTQYKLGEWLDTSGGVIVREYKDGTTKNIGLVNSYVSGWIEAYNSGVGTYTLKVSYVESGILQETFYEITISE